MPYPNPSYVDGLQAVIDLSVYCYNNAKTYMTYNGDPSPGAAQTQLRNSDGQLIGSVTYIDGRTGTIAMQYDLATDEIPNATNLVLPDYIVAFRQRFYVLGAVKTPIVKNDVIKLSADATELQNPFFPALLSLFGQQKKAAIAATTPVTLSCVASNVRPGATVTYSVETFATPGSSPPSGVSINASSGLLSLNVTAGTYDIRVIAKDDIGDGHPIYGFGRYTPTAA